MTSLKEQLAQARSRLDASVGVKAALEAKRDETVQKIESLSKEAEDLDKAARLLSSIAEANQEETQAKIENIVTQGLQSIFEEDISFHILQKMRGRSVSVDFVVRSKMGTKTVETPVLDSRGGGLAALVGFLLRLVIVLLSQDPKDSVLFLDETFGMLSSEYEVKLAEFIRELVDQTGVQIVMVTHSDAYSDFADKKYRFSLHKGVTSVEEL